MKKSFWGISLFLLALLSCRRDEESLQNIDQIMTFYMKTSGGQDLLNPAKVGSYSQFSMNDVFGENDSSPVSFSGPTMQADSTYFFEYTAGATRKLLSSDASDNRIYQSKIAFRMNQKVNDTLFTEVRDTMEIQYRWTPDVFEVAKVFYNKNEVFSKTSTSGNTFTITK
ncbi:hypothetical protein ASG31_01880 [Chryseobacterium sp. Leaf404]|uniref:hypothetical protein n=1 Tax=unclassified Chryseobacterium TaxID=2593645 RepID=UPI0006F24953|nr:MULTISPECIES: hypothetical protein [unclassified Chryseobacterium]KQT22115.1 hypothetical protein ASG31_01880 [Chryseobacterium sp. Leaf404]